MRSQGRHSQLFETTQDVQLPQEGSSWQEPLGEPRHRSRRGAHDWGDRAVLGRDFAFFRPQTGSNGKIIRELGHFILHWHHRGMPDVQDNANLLKSGAFPSESELDILPRSFERYLLLKRIARGGMGEVFLATPAGTIEGAERPCVIKVIRREHLEDSSFVARFLDEARIQSQLEHPGVVRVLEAALDSVGKPYCAFEHVEGRNLSELRLRAQQLGVTIGWPDAVAIAMTLCEGLAHVHERTDAFGQPLDIVHRDLSPQNVMVAYGGDVKVIDFGTARGHNRRCHTIAGIVFAKPGYVAPEVANNNPGGIPADIYAVGVMLWELLSGRRFLTGEASEHLAAVAAGTRVPGPVADMVQAPPELDVILQRMVATAIEDRYPSAVEAMSDFAQLLKRAPSTVDGQRSVRVRVSQLMQRLYPAEPTRTRAEFQRLLACAKQQLAPASAMVPAPSPEPPATQEAVDPDVLTGTRYRLLGELGRGSSGQVHEAMHLDLGRRVALKLLSREAASDATRMELFRREASTIAQLEHENIVTVYDFGKTGDDRAYFAMERLRGEPLDKHLHRNGVLEWRSAVGLMLQACRALHAAHQAGVIHRDIKPANLFLTRSGVLKLLDFGVARLVNHPSEPVAEREAFVLYGTPEYMAPELAKGAEPTAGSDVYALATVLYELVTGERPFQADSIPVLLDTKCKTAPVCPSKHQLGLSIPKALDRILLAALSPSAASRYATADEFGAALESVLANSNASGVRSSKRVTRIAAELTLLGVVSAAALYVSPELRDKSQQAMHWAEARLSTNFAAPHLQKSVAAVKAYSENLIAKVSQAQSRKAAIAAASQPVAAPEPVEQQDAVAQIQPSTQTTIKGPAPVLESSTGPDDQLEKISMWLSNGQPSRALRAARDLAERHPKNVAVLTVWQQAALQTKAWGEARSVAEKRARFDRSQDALLSLARLQKSTGQADAAKGTLRRALELYPASAEVKAQLEQLDSKSRVAAR